MKTSLNTIDRLRSSGLRPTKQRIAIVDYLFNREKTFHFTVEDIQKNLKTKSNQKISLATFYNTINTMKKFGHLKEIKTNDNKSYFDTNIKSHHHFYDEKQNLLTDIDYDSVELKKIPSLPSGKKLKNIEVTIKVEKV